MLQDNYVPIMFALNRLSSTHSQAKEAMDTCLEVFLNERDHRPDTRRAVIERVCVPFLLHSSVQALKEFFVCHIQEIMGIVEAKLIKVCIVNFSIY